MSKFVECIFWGDIIFTKKLKILNEREVNELFN